MESENISKIKKITSIMAEVAVRIIAVTVIIAAILGYRVLFVMSGSMEPVIREGQMIVVRRVDDARELEVGDIVTYLKPEDDYTVTHRIIEVTDEGFVTKGDYNVYADQLVVEPEWVKYKVVWY